MTETAIHCVCVCACVCVCVVRACVCACACACVRVSYSEHATSVIMYIIPGVMGGKCREMCTRYDGRRQKERLGQRKREIYIPEAMEEKGRERCTYYTRKELEKERERV